MSGLSADASAADSDSGETASSSEQEIKNSGMIATIVRSKNVLFIVFEFKVKK